MFKMICRLYHVSAVNYSVKKLGVKLNKMLNPRSKKQWYPVQMYDAKPMPTVKSLTKVDCEPGKQGVQRLAMLNKLFMKNITDLMSTGTVAMDIVGRGIEISKVKISPNFHTLNVFWVCKGDTRDEETEVLLQKIAGPLRHELSTLRVMGEVPYVIFVKDKHEANLVDLDRRLAMADYGEDYTPTEVGHLLKTEFTLDTKLSPEMKAKIKKIEGEIEVEEEPLPEMTHNVFGLDHTRIMNRLISARKRSKDAWSSLDEDIPVIHYRARASKLPDVDMGTQKQELADFLLKRQILQNKLYKEVRASRKDYQLSTQDNEDDEGEDLNYSDNEEQLEEE
ncbi:putative ribosome-binding factor A, mitochondrial, partial [Hyposmocoma kahamanoa]|uniref:putative ribosome-binding factor A, mitochondrial n=1 Tax=Hyposmocoma kahamanoa TaxID=1477025 RepID=UPI000E6D5BF1